MLKPRLKVWLHQFRNIHSSCSMSGLKKIFDSKIQEAKSERNDAFQNWAEFENRGFKKPEYMTCWLIEQYGNPKKVLKRDTINVGYGKVNSIDARASQLRQAVTRPNEILIKVHAASLNPIDVKMCQGYGHNLLNFRRNTVLGTINKFTNLGHENEFPLVLGRDFSGTVLDVGSGVFDIVPGDEVFGAQDIHRTGTLADYVCVDLQSVSHKPRTLSHVEAASVPYVALTTLSALSGFLKVAEGKRVLLLGGSGGIGTFAIQYLKAKGSYVGVTCNKAASKLCMSLGADQCFDYTTHDYEKLLLEEPRFDFVFDIVGAQSPDWARHFLQTDGSYSSLVHPILENTDNMGIVLGLSASLGSYMKSCLLNRGNKFSWSYFQVDRIGLLEVAKMIDNGLINPVVQEVFDYDNVPAAFDLVSSGKCKGKVVINVSGSPEATVKDSAETIIHL